MRIGIMGGSFDPIHTGHLHAAQDVLEKYGLDKVIFMPAGLPAMKQDRQMASAEDRYAMCAIACADNPLFEVSRIEIERAGITYTIDTMRTLREIYPVAQFFFIVGTDAFESFHKWRDAGEILKLCTIVEIPRTKINISSTQIRERIENGLDVKYFVHEGVERYIKAKKIYTGEIAKIKEKLTIELGRQRMMHSLFVMEEAVKLAVHHGFDGEFVQKARFAGLLHDCAKNICEESEIEDIKRICQAGGYELDDFFVRNKGLAHGFAGAVLAQRMYGVTDKEVLDAIAQHIFGKKDMTKLDKILFLADFIEPLRYEDDARKKARELAYKNVDSAVCFVLEFKVEDCRKKGKELHHQSLEALKHFGGK